MTTPAKRFRRGLVVGKFSPLHRGHMLLIQSAVEACDDAVVISYSKPEYESCGRAQRERWLKQLFPQVVVLVLDDESLTLMCAQRGIGGLMEVPRNDASDAVQRDFVGWLCWNILGVTVDAVFTSEDYGDGFAQALCAYFASRSTAELSVTHVCVDKQRKTIPVSGTLIRTDPSASRSYLDAQVYASFVRRICILGAESSGKTTLAAALAARLGTLWVPEFGRELWETKAGALQYDDMLRIATGQLAREEALASAADRWLVCDTSPLTTFYYSLSMFGQADAALAALADRAYDYTFLCSPDFPFVQDGTRREASLQLGQHHWYLNALKQRKIRFCLLEGALEDRLAQGGRALALRETSAAEGRRGWSADGGA